MMCSNTITRYIGLSHKGSVECSEYVYGNDHIQCTIAEGCAKVGLSDKAEEVADEAHALDGRLCVGQGEID